MRCLAVAEAVLALGVEAAMAVDEEAKATVPRLASSRLSLLPPEPRACALVLLDGYAFTTADERAWSQQGARIAVLEDAPGRPHACDLLIDPAPGHAEADYRPLAPGARLLLGPAYAPIAGAFARLRPPALARRGAPGPVRRVLVSMGLTDAAGLAPAALAALRSLPDVERIDVAVGRAAASLPAIQAAAALDPRVRLHLDASEMAELTAEADLAIGAAGGSSWERCALGLPTVAVPAVDNQAENARALAEAGAALVVGPDEIGAAVEALTDPGRRAAMSAAAAALVDGQGADRIARALVELAGLSPSGSGPTPAAP